MGVYIKNWSLSNWKELLKWAKIGANNAMIGEFTEVEEVPPHGRLIDADALRDNNCDAFEINGADGTILAMDVSIIDDAPTIIPASEEKMK